MAATGLYVEKVRVHVQHLVQEYRRNFYREQQLARTVPTENKLAWYLEVNRPYHNRYTHTHTTTTEGLERRAQFSLQLEHRK
jgi:hypothetical protein